MLRKTARAVLVLALCVVTLGVSSAFAAATTAMVKSTAVFFLDREPGNEPYPTRMLVTSKFLRIDDGTEEGDFLLFNRHQKIIYSVSRADKQVLAIAAKTITLTPPTNFTHKIVTDPAHFPSVGGHRVKHYELLTNGERCYDVYAAKGLLPEALSALREYRQALAGEQAAMVPVTPEEFENRCDLANHVFLPARHLAHGFPVRFSDMTGKTSELVDIQLNFKASAELFRLPESYKRLRIEDLRTSDEKNKLGQEHSHQQN